MGIEKVKKTTLIRENHNPLYESERKEAFRAESSLFCSESKNKKGCPKWGVLIKIERTERNWFARAVVASARERARAIGWPFLHPESRTIIGHSQLSSAVTGAYVRPFSLAGPRERHAFRSIASSWGWHSVAGALNTTHFTRPERSSFHGNRTQAGPWFTMGYDRFWTVININ